jgi:putative transposase
MPQSLASVYVHAVFSTRDRQPLIERPNDVHAQLGSISKNLNCQPLIVGGTQDHVHILAALARTITIADWVKEMKCVSSSQLTDFGWQSGYGVFSVGREQLDVVRAYISNQEEHHKKVSFQDEYRKILVEHGIAFDERYVWD